MIYKGLAAVILFMVPGDLPQPRGPHDLGVQAHNPLLTVLTTRIRYDEAKPAGGRERSHLLFYLVTCWCRCPVPAVHGYASLTTVLFPATAPLYKAEGTPSGVRGPAG